MLLEQGGKRNGGVNHGECAYHVHFLSTGQDASAAFEDIGHSPEARALTDQYRIGTVAGGHPKVPKDIPVSYSPEKTRLVVLIY